MFGVRGLFKGFFKVVFLGIFSRDAIMGPLAFGKRTVIASRDIYAAKQVDIQKKLTRPQTPSLLTIVALYKLIS
jgi:hypothetical protein